MTKKVITPASGSAQTIYYETNDNNTTVKFYAGGRYITSHSKTDSFGRKVFDELQLGVGTVSRQFSYHDGEVTEEHIANNKQKSSATTQLVSKITLSDGRTLSYEYDAEERITKVIDSVEGTTLYTYDALGQLLTETKNGLVVNTMTYDNYGNIKTKNGKTYTYDSTWKDLLKSYDGKSITYDAQGNPTSYLGHTLTWEKGRQLKSFDSNTYTYNANGIRTSKTVNGVKHTYTLDGAKILRETWGSNTSIPLYDNEDSVCGIIYNNNPYYFLKNLQGDVIAITDDAGTTIARYTYDAWGKCTIVSDGSGVGIATINPFRYRSYYYDTETELYYLQSRYYSPEVGRFINADRVNIALLHAYERKTNATLYSYCDNNVVNLEDIYGMTPPIFVGLAIALGVGISTFALSIRMYEKALANRRVDNSFKFYDWFGIGSYLKMRVKASGIIDELVRSLSRKIYLEVGSKTYNQNINFYGYKNPADLDLKYSVGGTRTFKLKVTKTARKSFWYSGWRKHKVEITMKDRYDFHHLAKEDGGTITRVINNIIGYYPQEWNLLKPYWWTFSCSYTCNI